MTSSLAELDVSPNIFPVTLGKLCMEALEIHFIGAKYWTSAEHRKGKSVTVNIQSSIIKDNITTPLNGKCVLYLCIKKKILRRKRFNQITLEEYSKQRNEKVSNRCG